MITEPNASASQCLSSSASNHDDHQRVSDANSTFVRRSSHHDALLLASFADIACKEAESSPIPSVTKYSAKVTPKSRIANASLDSHASVNNSHHARHSPTVISRIETRPNTDTNRPRAISYSTNEIASKKPQRLPIYPKSVILSLPIAQRMILAPTPAPAPAPAPMAPTLPILAPAASTQAVASAVKPQATKPTKILKHRTILRKKFSWKHYPALEDFLIANREEYLRHSTMNYTIQQKKYNNMLTEQMITLASQHGLLFNPTEFSFVTVRDRIRCYYKSYVQSLKKRGIVCGYAARKAGLLSKEEIEKNATTQAKIYVPN